MKPAHLALVVIWLATLAATTTRTPAQTTNPKASTLPQSPLSEIGQKLEAQYTQRLQTLRAEISQALPEVDAQKKSDWLQAREAEKVAKSAVKSAQTRLAEIAKARALVAHAKDKWIAGAEKGIADANARFQSAATDAERMAAQQELAKWQQNKAEGIQALSERQAAWEKTEREIPDAEKDLQLAEAELARAGDALLAATQNLGLQSFLASDQLDSRLAEYVVLLEATPRGLAAFAQTDEANRLLIDQMLADKPLLLQMVIADGANGGQYGRAMQIYDGIQKASDKASVDSLQRLALAVSLEHAVPIAQRNALDENRASATVDPVHRYLHFERAFLAEELDPCFKDLSVWEYRMVVDGEEPDEILAWGRQMLRNYRPDLIATSDYRWRYVNAVRTEVRYGSQDNKYDRSDLQFFQNILMNGGVCGRRAFFGRFILRAFGVPTTARPQRGHAALVHWTPEGWVVCLGANWGNGWTKTRYTSDLDFLANTQARAMGKDFMRVKRAQWIGDVMGEPRVFGLASGDPAFWNAVALYTQRDMIEQARTPTLAAVGEDIGEADESHERAVVQPAKMSAADREISVAANGTITIPASATSRPTTSTGKILFMDSNLGGKQLHYSRNGKPEDFEYTVDVTVGGKYTLRARVVTPSWRQALQLRINDSPRSYEIPLPFTVGQWETTEPVEIDLAGGRNVLRFSREGEVKGCTIKDFTLTPLDARAGD